MSKINPMYASMGLDIAQGVGSFVEQGIASKLARKMQKYRNEMLAITAAMQQGTILENRVNTRDASIRLQVQLQLTAAEDQATATVSAAAAGVKGGSVDSTMRGLRRSAANAQGARKARLQMEMRAHDSESRNVTVSAILGKDVSVISRPSLLANVVGLGRTLLDTYEDDQPPE